MSEQEKGSLEQALGMNPDQLFWAGLGVVCVLLLLIAVINALAAPAGKRTRVFKTYILGIALLLAVGIISGWTGFHREILEWIARPIAE